jgi:hypothetical protein
VRVLSRREARIVAALAETMFPEGGAFVGSRGARVVEEVDAFMSEVGPIERGMMRSMFGLFEVGISAHAPAGGRPGHSLRFSKASLEHRRQYIAHWETSDIYVKRLAFQALRSTFLIAYLHSGDVLHGIGVEDGEAVLARWQARRGTNGTGRTVLDRPVSNHPSSDPLGGPGPEAPIPMRREAGRGR